MSTPARKIFSIERNAQVQTASGSADEVAAARHDELLSAIAAVCDNAPAQQGLTPEVLEKYRVDISEAERLKTELCEMQKAIVDTKKEIATLHLNSFSNAAEARVADELDAVVTHTERATETILTCAETIDNNASNLAASLENAADRDMACDIQDQVVGLFEACNFQDLTGQRISKVVSTLKFIERRIDGMMEIWGGSEGFVDVEPEAQPRPDGDRALLNGPSLDDELDCATQDDIDALFG